MPKPKTIAAEVLPKSTDTVSVLTNVSVLEAPAMAAAIEHDIEQFERTSREAAFIALRIGIRLVWVRDNSAYGGLAKFIAQFEGRQTDRTPRRYIQVAERFLVDARLVEKKTNRLTDGNAIAPILQSELQLFTDPNAEVDGAVQKLVKWVGDRGLSDLYKEGVGKGQYQRRDEDNRIIAGKGKHLTEEVLTQRATDEITTLLNHLDGWFVALHHTRISKDLRLQSIAVLEEAQAKLKALR